jgi:error-prone DNA polymerase
MRPFVELHARSAFSFLEGASSPEEIAERAAALGQPAAAILDRDNVSAAPRFYKRARQLGLRAHIGAEISAAGGSRFPLLAENRTGYRNLCRLITRMKLRAPKGEAAAALDDFADLAGGLVCLTGGESGPLARAIARGEGRECLDRLRSIFGRAGVFVEIQRHRDREEEARNHQAIALARSAGMPVVATNGACYAAPERRELADVFTCLRHKTTISKAGRLLARNSEAYLKSTGQMASLFSDIPEAIENAAALSARLGFELSDFGYEFPRYPVPPGETMTSFLRALVGRLAPERFRPFTPRVTRQLERELALIEKLGLEGYFLIVWDLVEFCRREKLLVQGRGSAANSAVCYALGITAVDPVKMELLFERFLSEERGEWPDIDLDLPSGDQREKVIQHVYRRYGKLGAAMTANVITYRGRSAIRDIGKVLEFDADALARLARLIPQWGWRDPDHTAERQFRDAGLDPANPAIGKFLALYAAVRDLPRHLGQHSGGMVICQGQLDSIVPLEPATMPGRVVIQWDKEDCADMGLIKVDLLGLGMLAVLEETTALVREHHGERVDLAHLPENDPAVYDALQRADTIGMFQVESRAQMSCLPRMRPRNFYDIAVQVAIIRPGPIVGKMLNPYLRRRQGKEAAVSLHPSLDTVLARTLGVPLFQEQLLRIAMIAAGFSGGEAEELRRAMGFKRSAVRMKEIEVRLREGMTRNGIGGEAEDAIVQSISSFALYGFPESHAISFALIAYASAYLKCHYLAAFTAAMLNNQPMGFYSPSTLVKDAQRHGLRVLPVHVNESVWPASVADRATIRLGLNYVRGLSQEAGEALVAERARGRFASVDDLRRRVPALDRGQLTALASVGALNFAGVHRRGALWDAALLAPPAGGLLDAAAPSGDCPLQPMEPMERLEADIRGLGLSVGRHPVAYARAALDRRRVLPASALARRRDRSAVRVAGCVICRQRPETAKGFVFLSLEDETGVSNVIVEPPVFDRFRDTIIASPFLLIHGTLQNQEGVVSVRAQSAEGLHFGALSTGSHDFY